MNIQRLPITNKRPPKRGAKSIALFTITITPPINANAQNQIQPGYGWFHRLCSVTKGDVAGLAEDTAAASKKLPRESPDRVYSSSVRPQKRPYQESTLS